MATAFAALDDGGAGVSARGRHLCVLHSELSEALVVHLWSAIVEHCASVQTHPCDAECGVAASHNVDLLDVVLLNKCTQLLKASLLQNFV